MMINFLETNEIKCHNNEINNKTTIKYHNNIAIALYLSRNVYLEETSKKHFRLNLTKS